MHPPSLRTRRDFITATAATAGGLWLLGGASELLAASTDVASTEHFYYKLGPAWPYIDSQRENKAFGFGDGKIALSEDSGKTWPHQARFADAANITFSCILKNGNILFATREQIFLSTDNLKTHRRITVKNRDGSDYLPHQPVDAEQPGWYFHSLDGEHTWDVNGREMMVWGNYCNVVGGAVPVNIFYTTDYGQTIKVAYSFGQNQSFQQKGATAGNYLGDPTNPVICRHIHCVTYNPVENAFYACTGDIDRGKGQGKECHWLRGTYSARADTWDWKVIVSSDSDSRYKCGGINFVDGRLYWISDANGPKRGPKHDRGIFACAPADLTNPARHTLLFNPEFESANLLIQDGVMIATHCAPASTYKTGIIYSPDMGKTWRQYDLAEFGPRSGVRIHRKNSDGWFRMDLRKKWIDFGEVLFLKPKG
jgi:hypothetical protein